MTTSIDSPQTANSELVGSRIGRINPDNFQNQSGAAIDDDDDTDQDTNTEEDVDDEPLDEDGDPTGEHDHHQDDNYALGGHVTRSGS